MSLAAIQVRTWNHQHRESPHFRRHSTSTAQALSFAVSIGTLALAATVIVTGAIADRIGVRKVIMYGLILEIVGNPDRGRRPGLYTLLLGRIIAGFGMGALFAGAFSMVPEIAGKVPVTSIIGQWTGMLYIFTIVFPASSDQSSLESAGEQDSFSFRFSV